ncbi:MAG: CoA-acylating methylmalonate-semialdehyde dehydrogenase [Proteobacteria bacterium]|nr:CoA-acylating methylmalonate-semialdehyde dehydrogenase [Pseudomonadota bacterium]
MPQATTQPKPQTRVKSPAKPTYPSLINGEAVAGDLSPSPIHNPATGEVIAHTEMASGKIIDQAVAVAKEALPAWAATPPIKRARVMFAYKELLEKHIDDLAYAISHQHGKTLADAKGEVARGIEVVEFACGIPHLLRGDFTANVAHAVDSYSLRQPLGVVAGITPFNFPAMVPMWMFPIALACGNCFILKPSEKDPAAPTLALELLQKAGLPQGVMAVVNGGKEAVNALLTHPDIRAISFVGSTHIAEYIYTTAAKHGKRVQALGGAKNHMLVMPDANLDQSVDALMGAAFGSAGERCMAVSVAMTIDDATADRLVEKLTPKIEDIRIGGYDDPEAEMGPLISLDHKEKVLGYIDAGVGDGAKLVVDGRKFARQGYGQSKNAENQNGGYFIGGSLFDHVTPNMSIYTDEIFAPVLSVVRCKSFDEATGLIDAHTYGNGAAIFTSNGDVARLFADRVRIGMVGVNVPIPVPVAFHSFGGWKRSLFGDHAMYGMEGVRFYTQLKTITARWPTAIGKGAQFQFPS